VQHPGNHGSTHKHTPILKKATIADGSSTCARTTKPTPSKKGIIDFIDCGCPGVGKNPCKEFRHAINSLLPRLAVVLIQLFLHLMGLVLTLLFLPWRAK
jgi:hypothetical protein